MVKSLIVYHYSRLFNEVGRHMTCTSDLACEQLGYHHEIKKKNVKSFAKLIFLQITMCINIVEVANSNLVG